MIVNIILFFIPIILTITMQEIKRNNKIKKEIESAMQREIAFARKFNSFSISDYISRRERTILDMMEQREKEEPYIITLWLGLDGLQLNHDGSTEWVSRRREEPEDESEIIELEWETDFVRDSCGNIHEVTYKVPALQNSPENDIAAMQLQQMRSQLQSVCAYQNMNTQSTIQHQIAAQCQNAILPAYPTYAPLFMTQNTPYWTYSAGGNFGTYNGR